MLLSQGSESLLDLEALVGLGLNPVVRVPDPLLGDVNLLGNLNIVGTKSHKAHKIVKFERCKRTNARQNIRWKGVLANSPTRGPSSMT